ncbi:DUF4191 domain-containing protein [Haematomicrobium sanguinis]|uniref:DUF4191 domain-containing protein n=1 Tax=Haematomicrobium sanguinis TaxID=479106 RepID=UPI00047C5748|nr:DUF4191 domain-containing protein [Haematomicrobium sanguinis]
MADSTEENTQERRGLFRRKPKNTNPNKEPGRLKQMGQVFQMTRKYDSTLIWWMLLAFLGTILVGLVIGFLLGGLTWITMLLIAIPLGLLLAMIVLSRKAERAAFANIEGKPGAAGAALGTLRRGWIVEEQPVAVSPRTQDVVFRAIGRPGIVLVTEGPRGRVRPLVNAETKKVNRVAPNVPVHVIETGRGEGQTELRNVTRDMKKLPKTLTKAEVHVVNKRLASLAGGMGIPKGVDPFKARPDRKAMRGR